MPNLERFVFGFLFPLTSIAIVFLYGFLIYITV